MGLRALDLQDEKPICAAVPKQPPVLELQNVSLAYKKQPVLRNLSLQAAPGDIIAIVGHNGAGKTTFSRALCGLHKETSGSYLWNGNPQKPKERMKSSYMVMQDVNYQLFAESVEAECTFGIKHPDATLAETTLKELGLAPFRARHPNTLSGGQKQRLAAATSMVCGKDLLVFDEPTSGLDFDSMVRLAALIQRLSKLGKIIFIVTHDYEFVCRTCKRVLHLDDGRIQDNFLFDNTVRENIRMGRPDATDAEVEQAARDCGCYDFIMSLENGFNTQVGSGGGHLSGGEKQRISIARAMLKNAPIVILDEATAYTDPENEAIIQESVARLVRGKTLIVIAHRLSTIVDADQIVVVNDGCIEATGTQAELLQACPLYETLWNAHIASRDSAEGGADRA